MGERDEARLRNAGNRERFAIRRETRWMVAEEHALARDLARLTQVEYEVETTTEVEWRRTHWGRDPEVPWSWPPREERRRADGRGPP